MGFGTGHGTLGNATMTRREFLIRCGGVGLGLCAAGLLGRSSWATPQTDERLKEAHHYKTLPGGKTQCLLCPQQCVRANGEDGMCHARGNRGGKYYSLVYGKACVIALDEVEKCPLHHFQVQGKAFSIATAGCNLTCQYCQNWQFSQVGPKDAPKSYDLSPSQVVAKAVEHGAPAIAYFYTEPTVYYEYMLDTARLARKQGLKNVMVTAGYLNPRPLEAALPLIDAVSFGLKGWNADFYRQYVGGELRYVKQAMQVLARQKDAWWEVVTLIVPSLNDSMKEVTDMAAWLRDTAGDETPLHFTRFRPEYRLQRLPMTPDKTLTEARQAALAQGLKYVYVGNMPGHEGAHTYCPNCRRRLVERLGFTVIRQSIVDGKCASCGHAIRGVWR